MYMYMCVCCMCEYVLYTVCIMYHVHVCKGSYYCTVHVCVCVSAYYCIYLCMCVYVQECVSVSDHRGIYIISGYYENMSNYMILITCSMCVAVGRGVLILLSSTDDYSPFIPEL